MLRLSLASESCATPPFMPIKSNAELESDEKVGNDESCRVYLLQIPFHSSAKGVQAPNDTNSEMKAANLTVGTELWFLTAYCLPRFYSWRNRLALYTGGVKENQIEEKNVPFVNSIVESQFDVGAQSFVHASILYSICL